MGEEEAEPGRERVGVCTRALKLRFINGLSLPLGE
jgi:hypothetical protein